MATNLSPLLTAISRLPWSFQATTWNQHLPNHSKMSIAPIVLGLLWLRLHNPHTTRGNPESNQSTHWVSWSMTGLQQVTGHLLTTTTTPMTALLTFSPAPLHPRGDSTPFFALKKRQWNSTLKSHSEQRLSVYYLHQQSKDFSLYKTKINPLDPVLITEGDPSSTDVNYIWASSGCLCLHQVRFKDCLPPFQATGGRWVEDTPTGQYKYLVVPFRLTYVPAVFQSLINDVLREFLNVFVFVYLNDTLIYLCSVKEQKLHICRVMQWLLKNKLYIMMKKSEYNRLHQGKGSHWLVVPSSRCER